jgi:hypothetical protein
MTHEIKIIMKYELEGIDSDIDVPVTTGSIIVYHNDIPIGCIQELKIHARVDSPMPEIEISFPDLRDPQVSTTPIFNSPTPPTYFADDIDENVKIFSRVPGVQVKLIKLDAGNDTNPLLEIGTDGAIDLIPMVKLP